MSLSEEYFQRRDEEKKKYLEKEYADLEDVLEQRTFCIQSLENAGIFIPKSTFTTADLYLSEPHPRAKHIFTIGDYQLLLVKKEKLKELNEILDRLDAVLPFGKTYYECF